MERNVGDLRFSRRWRRRCIGMIHLIYVKVIKMGEREFWLISIKRNISAGYDRHSIFVWYFMGATAPNYFNWHSIHYRLNPPPPPSKKDKCIRGMMNISPALKVPLVPLITVRYTEMKAFSFVARQEQTLQIIISTAVIYCRNLEKSLRRVFPAV
jgi:hypothetical protein